MLQQFLHRSFQDVVRRQIYNDYPVEKGVRIGINNRIPAKFNKLEKLTRASKGFFTPRVWVIKYSICGMVKMANRVITILKIELPAANCFLILLPPKVPSHSFIVVAVSPPKTQFTVDCS